jgi:hypothetical protein
MNPRPRDVVGAGIFAAILIGLVAVLFFATWRSM